MVRLINKQNTPFIAKIVSKFFLFQAHFTRIIECGNPNISPCIYALWHTDQFGIYGIHDKGKTNVLISKSLDGDIVATGVEALGFKTIRGSKGKKGAVEASMHMISALKEGDNCIMMVDGPRGPAKKVKKGIIKIAKLSGAPIIPLIWYSENLSWVQFPSWDKMHCPVLATNMVNVYGKPIYVPEDRDEEDARLELQHSLEDLATHAPQAFHEEFKFGIWRRKK